MTADWLRTLEARLAGGGEEELGEAIVSLAWVAGREVTLAGGERRAAGRRALLLLAAGGDPSRGLDLDGRAVTAIAADLDEPGRRAAVARGLDLLAEQAGQLPRVASAIDGLRGDPELAWRAFAAAILAEELDAD